MRIDKATTADTPRLARSLARAFYDDPAIKWIVPDGDRRRRVGPLIFSAWLSKMYLPKNHVYTDPERRAAALWAPPGDWRMSAAVQLRVTPVMMRIVGLKRLPLIGKGLKAVDKHHPDERPHWYLAMLGTDPEFQGKGLGSALMEPVLQRCDADGLGAYLESSNEANIPFYRRHAFEIIGQLSLPEGPPLWPMWRDPQPL